MHLIISRPGLITCPYAAYVLGFLWGDGNLFKHPQWSSRGVACEIAYDDFLHLKPIFAKTGDWKILVRERFGKRYGRLYMTNAEGHAYLTRLRYANKHLSHRRVMDVIDSSVQRFFVLGLFDADGHIGCLEGGKQSRVSICGPRNQQWGPLRKWLKKHGVSTKVSQHHRKNSSAGWSYLHMKSVWDIPPFSRLLYQGAPPDLMLQRKQDVFDQITTYLNDRYPSKTTT